MIATRLKAASAAEPFADDAAGFEYFATEFHYEYLVARLRRHLVATRGFYLVSGAPAPEGELLANPLNARKDAQHRATLVRCHPAMTLDAVMRAFARQLGLGEASEGGGQWSLLSRLMEDSRKGVVHVLVLENADALDDRGLEELHRFATLDDPHFLPVVLLTQRSFAARLDTPGLQFLQPAIVAHMPLQRLEAEEVAAFIRYQLNASEGKRDMAFTREAIAAIAAAAKGDPAVVNRLARQAAGIVGRARAPLAAPPVPAEPPPAMPTPQLEQPPVPLPTPVPAKPEPQLKAEPRVAVGAPGAAEPAKEAAPPLTAPATEELSGAKPPAARRKSMAPVASLAVATLMRARAMTPAATIAGYILLAATSATGLFYVLAPNGARDAVTRAADLPQLQTAFSSDLPLPEPLPPTPESIAAAAAPPSPPPPPPPESAVAATQPPAAAAPEPPAVPAPVPTIAAPALPQAEAVAAAESPPASAVAAAPPEEPVATEPPPAVAALEAPPATAAIAAPSQLAQELAAIEPKAGANPAPEAPAEPARSEPGAAAPPAESSAPPAAAPVETVAKLEAAPLPLPPRVADKLPSGAAVALVRRGEALLASGDIVSARQFFARAAETGDAAAALGLGKSYDPLVLRRVGTRGIAGDAAKAVDWYRRAARAGSNEAAARLARLLVQFPQ